MSTSVWATARRRTVLRREVILEAIMPATKNQKALVGSAGVHYVASELSRRGLVALTTTRNTQGFDVVVASPSGRRHANIEVKTSLQKVGFWPVGKQVMPGPRNFYVFLRYIQ